MYELKVTGDFAAAHKLAMVTEKCENLHGHNWKVELYIKSDSLNDAGVVMDFGILKKYLREILGKLDHKYLNELLPFKEKNASSENIARFISFEIDNKLKFPGISVSKVVVWESDDACAIYHP